MLRQPFSEPPVGTLFEEEELEAIRRVLRSGETLTRGKDVERFEEEFARSCEALHAVAVSSCTAALRIAVQLLRIRRGDEVIVPANAFWNTVVALVERGAVLRVADVDGYTLNIDPACVEALITKRTCAIWIMSFGGNPCDMRRLRTLARRHHLPIVEDAAHSAGAVYRGKRVGSLSDITCFSFASLKNMSTLGEGGMLTTPHQQYAEDARKLRECWPIGQFRRTPRTRIGPFPKPVDAAFLRPGDAYDATWTSLEEVGTNCKMSTPAAAVGRVQLRKLDRHNALRRAIAARYDAAIRRMPGTRTIAIYPQCQPSWHLYTFFLLPESGVERDTFVATLKRQHGIQLTNRFWPIHLHGILRMHGHRIGEAPVYERIWFRELVALPIAPRIQKDRVRWLAKAVSQTYASLSSP